jgi:hypothetical protein
MSSVAVVGRRKLWMMDEERWVRWRTRSDCTGRCSVGRGKESQQNVEAGVDFLAFLDGRIRRAVWRPPQKEPWLR